MRPAVSGDAERQSRPGSTLGLSPGQRGLEKEIKSRGEIVLDHLPALRAQGTVLFNFQQCFARTFYNDKRPFTKIRALFFVLFCLVASCGILVYLLGSRSFFAPAAFCCGHIGSTSPHSAGYNIACRAYCCRRAGLICLWSPSVCFA